MATYPIIKEHKTHAVIRHCFSDKIVKKSVVKHIKEIWEKPNTKRKLNVWYIVDDRYKIISETIPTEYMDVDILEIDVPVCKEPYTPIVRRLVEAIIDGHDLNDNTIKLLVKGCNTTLKLIKNLTSTFDYFVEVLEKNKKWRLVNCGSVTGIVPPKVFVVEKIN